MLNLISYKYLSAGPGPSVSISSIPGAVVSDEVGGDIFHRPGRRSLSRAAGAGVVAEGRRVKCGTASAGSAVVRRDMRVPLG